MSTELDTAILESTTYHFDERRIANWTIAQEKSISQDYPFLVNNESLEDYVARIYLQFLWLPESLMPLHLLVPSLKRVSVPSTSNSDASVHPMHALLQPLLLNTRSAMDKYHVELPQILADGGGAGEMEETMMWYGLTHEKVAESVAAAHASSEHADGPWSDDAWRETYLERMERREVQIQILLYLYKLSLPGPHPPMKKPKRKSFKSRQPVEPVLSTEDHLEAFMDKLSTWQLLGTLDRVQPTAKDTEKKDERDWMQIFAEDVVERCFKAQLPDLTVLLRSKVFPNSLFSDSEDLGSNAPASPKLTAQTTSIPPTKPTLSRSTSRSSSTRPLERARSRSLSVSLAQEQQERDRAYAAPTKKRILNREVSMSRVFKPKTKPTVDAASMKTEAPPKPKTKDTDVILVQETPQKPRATSSQTMTFGKQKLPMFGTAAIKLPAMGGKVVVEKPEEDEDEEWMMMDSSPDIVLLNPTRSSSTSSGVGEMESGDEDHESADQANTPCKPSKIRRRR